MTATVLRTGDRIPRAAKSISRGDSSTGPSDQNIGKRSRVARGESPRL